MFFDIQKGAFRAGVVDGNHWDNINIGDYSVAMGDNAVASGWAGVALGDAAQARAISSFAAGFDVLADGDYSVALGRKLNITATGDGSAGFGLTTTNPATLPQITGAQSFALFMGNHSGVTFSSPNTMGLFGGRMVIDPRVPAVNLVADTAFEVEGAIKIAYDSQSCAAAREGAIRYNSATDTFELCKTAGSWTNMQGGAASAGGSDRQIQFNNAGTLGGVSWFDYKTDGRLEFWTNATGTAGSDYKVAMFMADVAPTGNQTAGRRTIGLSGNAYVPAGNTYSIQEVVGTYGYADNRGSGTVNKLTGTLNYVWTNAGTVNNLIGGYAGAEIAGGSVGTAFGYAVETKMTAGTANTVNGLTVSHLMTGGTVTNRYGIYLATPEGSATNDWGIYQIGTQNNRLNGALGIGVTPSSAKLQVYSASTSAGNFATDGATSVGVYAWAGHTTGANYGLFGETASTSGRGVYGKASAATGTTYGVMGETASTTGRGVYGYASTATGTNYGVFGFTNSTAGYGVYGQNSNATGYGIYCQSGNTNGCAGNRAWFNASDARLKDHVIDLGPDSGIDAIMRLRPVRYEWKDKNSARKPELGFLAQDVEKIFPELVGIGPDQVITLPDGSEHIVENAKVMSYSQITVPLVKAVQELKAENDDLRRSVEDLQAANDNLEQRLNRLEARSR